MSEQILDAAEALFYARGVHAVGMADIRTAAGVSLKRLYRLFPSKDQLLLAVLDRRDERWRGRVAAYVDARGGTPTERLLAVFDWLELWVGEPGYRGCAWINCFGELGAQSPEVLARVRGHKAAFRGYLVALAADAGREPELAEQLLLLFEGATVTAAITADSAPARQARTAARALAG